MFVFASLISVSVHIAETCKVVCKCYVSVGVRSVVCSIPGQYFLLEEIFQNLINIERRGRGEDAGSDQTS